MTKYVLNSKDSKFFEIFKNYVKTCIHDVMEYPYSCDVWTEQQDKALGYLMCQVKSEAVSLFEDAYYGRRHYHWSDEKMSFDKVLESFLNRLHTLGVLPNYYAGKLESYRIDMGKIEDDYICACADYHDMREASRDYDTPEDFIF